jgi:hypothetical protein
VRVFTPRDHQNRHQFHFFGDPEHDARNPLKAQPTDRAYNFELPPDGLQMYAAPEIDPRLSDFSAEAGKWCQEDYFVTIDLPAPKRITFTPPLRPVKFKNHEGRGCISFNHVLEYDITHLSAVKMLLGDKVFGPTRCAELIRRYEDACKKNNTGSRGDLDADQQRPHGCTDMNEYLSTCPESAFTFFFGVGLAPGPDEDDRTEHAIRFFNERILESFPDLKKRLEILRLGRRGEPCKSESSGSQGAMAPAILEQRPSEEPRLLEVSHITDCQLSGPVATTG